jgi:hypothetical protein
MAQQAPLTLITPIRQGHRQQLVEITDALRDNQLQNLSLPFENLGTIHYLRLVLLDEIKQDDGTILPERFVLSINHDGEVDEHLLQLSKECASFLDQLYVHCEGYPESRTPEIRTAYLKKWILSPTAAFAGAKGVSLKRIRGESQLRNKLWQYLHDNNWKNKNATVIHQELKHLIANDEEFNWSKAPVKLPKIKWVAIIIVLVLLLPLILLLVVLVAIWVLIIHFFFESKDVPLGLKPSQISEEHIQKLEVYEDYYHQNQFTQVLFMKPGKARLYTLLSFFQLAKLLIRFLFVDYKLMDIPTIHFASWMMMDKNKTMLFFSNFDGSWQQYLGDFIDKSGWGLTGIWSNTAKFPKTRFLFFGGAYDEEHFLAWSRTYQIPTQLWYCAYPDLSIKNISNNSWIRQQLFKDLNEKQAKAFLQRI